MSTHHSFLIRSSVVGHLDWLHFLEAKNRAAVRMVVQVSLRSGDSVIWVSPQEWHSRVTWQLLCFCLFVLTSNVMLFSVTDGEAA